MSNSRLYHALLLVEHGNAKIARGYANETDDLSPDDAGSLARAIHSPVSSAPAVYAVIVDVRRFGNVPISTRLEISADPPKRVTLGESCQEALLRALDDSWKLVDGPDKRPEVFVRLPIVEAFELEVDGSSLYLPTLMAAVCYFADEPLPRKVMATGDFSVPLKRVDEKLSAFDERREGLGLGRELCIASLGQPQAQHERLRVFSEPETAIEAIWGTTPWHPRASVLRLHPYFGEKRARPPAGWDDTAIKLDLGDQATPESLDANVATIKDAMGDNPRVEINLGGPLILAAKLGAELKNGVASAIALVHEGQSYWIKGTGKSFGASQPRARGANKARVVVGYGEPLVPPGWEFFEHPDHLLPTDFRKVICGFMDKYGGVKELDLAFRSPWPLAWAIAEVLRNQIAVHYFHRVNGEYVEWFEIPG